MTVKHLTIAFTEQTLPAGTAAADQVSVEIFVAGTETFVSGQYVPPPSIPGTINVDVNLASGDYFPRVKALAGGQPIAVLNGAVFTVQPDVQRVVPSTVSVN